MRGAGQVEKGDIEGARSKAYLVQPAWGGNVKLARRPPHHADRHVSRLHAHRSCSSTRSFSDPPARLPALMPGRPPAFVRTSLFRIPRLSSRILAMCHRSSLLLLSSDHLCRSRRRLVRHRRRWGNHVTSGRTVRT